MRGTSSRRAAAAAVAAGLALLVAAGGPSGATARSAPVPSSGSDTVETGCEHAAESGDTGADTADAGPATPPADGADRSASSPPDPRAVLRRAQERYRSLESLRAEFRERVQVPLLNRERSGSGTWYQKGRGLFKLDYSEPPEDVVVSDGTHVWTYYPSTQPGQVTRTALEKSARGREMVDLMGRIFREARQGYRAEYAGRESVGGVETHHVVLTPTGEAPYRRVELWIAPADHLVRKFDVTEENETVRTVTLTDLQPDAEIPDSVFRFEVPEGAEVFSG